MPSDEQQERLWYKIAMAHVVGHLLRQVGDADEDALDDLINDDRNRIRNLVRTAVRQIIEQHHPVTLMEWYNLSEEFKARAWRAVSGERL